MFGAVGSAGGYLGGMAARLACLLLGIGTFALASCGAGGETARTSSTPACHPADSHTLAADPLARVYALSEVVYGCSERTGRVTRLGRANLCVGSARAGPFALAAALAAYGLETCGVDTGFSQAVIRRLSDGKTLRSEAAITGPVGPESYAAVRSIVARSSGGFAWIAVASSIIGHGTVVEVHRADKHGAVRLDSGGTIDPSSLRLHGSTMSWKHGGARRSARLD